VWSATTLALVCSTLVFLATNLPPVDPVAEPVPAPVTWLPIVSSSTGTTSTVSAPARTTPVVTPPPPTATTTAVMATTTPRSPTPSKSVRPTPPTTEPPPPPTTTTDEPECDAEHWHRDTAYPGGSMVVYRGFEWTAKWWNYNAVPGANSEHVWERTQLC
jgi:hypothetical protein